MKNVLVLCVNAAHPGSWHQVVNERWGDVKGGGTNNGSPNFPFVTHLARVEFPLTTKPRLMLVFESPVDATATLWWSWKDYQFKHHIPAGQLWTGAWSAHDRTAQEVPLVKIERENIRFNWNFFYVPRVPETALTLVQPR